MAQAGEESCDQGLCSSSEHRVMPFGAEHTPRSAQAQSGAPGGGTLDSGVGIPFSEGGR